MKKTFLLLMILLGVVSMANAKTAIVYFSATGTTKALAQNAAKALNADIFEIIPEKPYTSDDLDWHNSKSRTSIECNDKTIHPGIKNKIELSAYDTVVVAFPIWWNNIPNILLTFAEKTDLSGKKVVCICTSGSSSISNAEREFKAAVSKTVDFRPGKRFAAETGEAELKRFLERALK